MATDKLGVYNLALTLLGDHRLVGLSDDVEARYALDSSWDRAVAFVFQAAYWRFALKTATLTHNGALTALPGYSSAFASPATYFRPHALFVLSGARECPIDVRQQGTQFHANVTPIYLRYVDNALIATEASWPETFAKAVAAYLAFDVSSRVSQDPQAPNAMFGIWQQYFGAAEAIEAVPADPWLDAQLSGDFLPASRYILEQGYWKFAVKSATIADSVGVTLENYTYGFSKPADWLKTQAIYLESGTKELPLDVREHGARWSANVDEINVRYLSNEGLTSTLWPDEFRAIVAAYLAARNPVTDEKGQTSTPAWVDMLQVAIVNNAMPESPWLQHQISGAFLPAARYILDQGFWRFALKTVTPSTGGTPVSGFSNAYAQPADWLKTQAVFKVSGARELPVDVREQVATWSANEAIKVRYLSSDGLDATDWPEAFTRVVAAYLGIDMGDGSGSQQTDQSGGKMLVWPRYLESALDALAIPESPWLDHQFSGRYLNVVMAALESGYWRFAVKTVEITANVSTPSSGYSYSFTRPTDWLRTFEVYQTASRDGNGIDFREENGQYHANYSPITVRYVSATLGVDAATWSPSFEDAVLAEMQLRRASESAGISGAALQALAMNAKTKMRDARSKDDSRERPRVNAPSRFVSGRFGGGWGYNSREQG